MKSHQLLIAVVCLLTLSSSFKTANKKLYDPKYYVATAKETFTDKSGYVVTNVVYVACDHDHTTTTVTNQLYTYYAAYYKKNRNSVSFGGRGDITAWAFDTRSAAESKRRELIAQYNDRKFDVLLIERFSVLCDE
ncbi:MAG TPA: hypothetical protein VK668_17110 [Mucilaginibacter sp.]|nr:hypothetical protein [Mucilaginibacter sp.]